MTTDKSNAAPDPQPAELAEQQRDARSLAEHITDHLCHHEYDIGGRSELLACIADALAATGKQQAGEETGPDPLTLAGLIVYGREAGKPHQGAVPGFMRSLIRQMVPHLERLAAMENGEKS
ncbi:hypothetical protein ACTT2I_05165 [Stenotrophomonas sp. PUT21]|uniref:hypothetical protein n=1 Tax=Stenotrophomonas TaxID=40323 RepID=UPI003B780BDD